jgi:hypothetical protein
MLFLTLAIAASSKSLKRGVVPRDLTMPSLFNFTWEKFENEMMRRAWSSLPFEKPFC